jgi:hypothetical protein
MNWGYLYVTNYKDLNCEDCFDQLKHSVKSLKEKVSIIDSINIYSDLITDELKEWCDKEGLLLHKIEVQREYSGLDISSVVAQKLFILRDYDQTKEFTLIDIDTEFINDPNFDSNTPTIWNIEYPLISARNLDTLMPLITFEEIGVEFNLNMTMKNTGLIYVPKKDRKEISEKAIWLVDYLNNGKHKPEDRVCNKLDEQISLSILLEFFYPSINTAEWFLNHYWANKMDGIKWY